MEPSVEFAGEAQIIPQEAVGPLGAASLFREVSIEELETMARESTARILHEITTEHPELEVREEQIECLDVLEEAREAGEKRALVQMATGLGKTTVVAADVKRFLEEKPDARVLFLCHQNRILDQAKERFEQIIGDDYSFGTFTGEGEKDYHEVTCLFASFQVMSDWHVAFKPDEFDYIVVDEAQHAKADTYEPTLKHFDPTFLLGVTATPDRLDMREIQEIFGPIKYQLGLEEALARELLARPDYHVILDEIEAERTLRSLDGRKLNIRQLNRSIFVPLRDKEMARIAEEKAAELPGPVRRLVFCTSIEQAEEFAQYFDKAAPIHTKLPTWEVKRNLELFRSGELETLVVRDMFNEGIDVPEVNQVLFLRMTASKTIFLQQLGRGLRKTPGKEVVQVLDFVANGDRLAMVNAFWNRVNKYVSEPSQPGAVERVKVADVHFSDSAREVLDILADIEVTSTIYRNWGREDSIEYYKTLSESIGKAASYDEVVRLTKELQGPSIQFILNKFGGTMQELRVAAGFEMLGFEHWSEQDMIDYYLGVSDKLGRPARTKDLHAAAKEGGPSLNTLLIPFNNKLHVLQERAGIEPTYTRHWVEEDYVKYYQRVAKELGHPPSGEELAVYGRKNSGPSRTSISQKVGGIQRLRILAGFGQSDFRDWSDEQGLEYYKVLSEDLGRPATGKDLRDAYLAGRGPSEGFFTIRFGGVAHVSREAGYGGKPRGTWKDLDREGAIAYYRELSEKLGHPATYMDINRASEEDGGPSNPTMRRALGEPIQRVRELIFGPTPKPYSQWTVEEYTAYYLTVSNELGRPANKNDFVGRDGPTYGNFAHKKIKLRELRKLYEAQQK